MDPVNKRIKKACDEAILDRHRKGAPSMHEGWQREETESWLAGQSAIYVQTDHEVDDVLERLGVQMAERTHLKMGYRVVKLIDLEYFDNLFIHKMEEEYILS